MSETIGDYIHFRIKNYLKYGIRQASASKSIQNTGLNQCYSALESQRALVRMHIGETYDSSIKDFEKLLNYFLNPTKSLEKSIFGTFTQEDAISIKKQIATAIKQKLGNLSVFFNDDTMMMNQRLIVNGWGDIQTDINKKTKINTVLKRVKKLEHLYKALQNSSNSFHQGFIEQMEVFNKEYQSFLLEFKQGGNINLNTKIAMINDLNQIWRYAKKSTFEYLNNSISTWFVQLAAYSISSAKSKNIDTLIDDFVNQIQQGNIKVVRKLRKKGEVKQENLSFPSQDKNLILQAQQNSNYVSLTLNLKDNQVLFNPVTRLKSNSKIDIVNNTNLIYYIQDYPIFANHFFNIISPNPRIGSNAVGAEYLKALQQQYINLIKITILSKTIMQNVSNQIYNNFLVLPTGTKAFILFDAKKNKFKIITFEKIINQLIKNESFIDNILIFKPDPFRRPFPNDYVGVSNNRAEAIQRIQTMLAYASSISLKASLDISKLP